MRGKFGGRWWAGHVVHWQQRQGRQRQAGMPQAGCTQGAVFRRGASEKLHPQVLGLPQGADLHAAPPPCLRHQRQVVGRVRRKVPRVHPEAPAAADKGRAHASPGSAGISGTAGIHACIEPGGGDAAAPRAQLTLRASAARRPKTPRQWAARNCKGRTLATRRSPLRLWGPAAGDEVGEASRLTQGSPPHGPAACSTAACAAPPSRSPVCCR